MELPEAKIAYSITETEEATGLGRTRIYEEIREGRLAAVKSGRRTLVPASALRRWLETLPPVKNGPLNE